MSQSSTQPKAPVGNRILSLSERSTDGSLLASVYRGREEKWIDMLYGKKSWNYWVKIETDYITSHRHRIKTRVRKGIPDSIRRCAWIALTGAGKLKAANHGRYRALLSLPIYSNSTIIDISLWGVGPTCPGAVDANSILHLVPQPDTPASRSVFDTIERDITRTFTRTAFFSDAIGQAKLFRVLVAFAQHDPVVGYCQGMAFVTALLVSFLGNDEEDVFWLLCSMMHSPVLDLAGLYKPGLPQVGKHLHILVGLLNTLRPKLGASLQANGIHVSMYASQWILTIFTYSFPLPWVARIFDSFLWEGWKTVYRVAVAVLIAFETPLLAAKTLEEIMCIFKLIPETLAGKDGLKYMPNATGLTDKSHLISNGGVGMANILKLMPTFDGTENDINTLMEGAFKLKFYQKDIQALTREYEALVNSRCETCGINAGCILRKTGISELPKEAQVAYLDLETLSRTKHDGKIIPTSQEERAITPSYRPSIASWGKT
jgi:TBC1 domain family member 10